MTGIESIAGGLVGLIGGVLNGWTEVRKHRAETERLRAQWDHDEKMAVHEANARREDNADSAFIESIKGDAVDTPFTLPPNASPALLWVLVPVEAMRRATRPLLTWGLVAAAYAQPHMAPGAWMAVGWWFGSRTTSRFLQR